MSVPGRGGKADEALVPQRPSGPRGLVAHAQPARRRTKATYGPRDYHQAILRAPRLRATARALVALGRSHEAEH